MALGLDEADEPVLAVTAVADPGKGEALVVLAVLSATELTAAGAREKLSSGRTAPALDSEAGGPGWKKFRCSDRASWTSLPASAWPGKTTGEGGQRTTRAPPPPMTFSTSLRLAMEVSPGVVMARAPWAAPYSTAFCGSPVLRKP